MHHGITLGHVHAFSEQSHVGQALSLPILETPEYGLPHVPLGVIVHMLGTHPAATSFSTISRLCFLLTAKKSARASGMSSWKFSTTLAITGPVCCSPSFFRLIFLNLCWWKSLCTAMMRTGARYSGVRSLICGPMTRVSKCVLSPCRPIYRGSGQSKQFGLREPRKHLCPRLCTHVVGFIHHDQGRIEPIYRFWTPDKGLHRGDLQRRPGCSSPPCSDYPDLVPQSHALECLHGLSDQFLR